MQNKNSKLNTVLLIIIIILLGVLIFWKMGDNDSKKLYSDENMAVDYYDPLAPDNKIEPTPNPTPTPTPAKKTSLTIDELYKKENLLNVSCGTIAPAESKSFTVNGYIYPGSVSDLGRNNRTIIRSIPDGNGTVLDIQFTGNTKSIIDSITKKYNSDPNAWINVQVQGYLTGHDLPVMGPCFRGFSIETSNVIVL